jgi:hypothetical protein
MTRRYLKLAIAGSLFTLSACAQQSEIRQMHQSVSTLSKEMTQLNQQTVKITQQNALNAKSTSGVYLLPEAKTPARLKSQIGTLRMSLAILRRMATVTPDARIQGESNDPLPAFSATVASGQITGTTESYQEVNVQDQLISAPASILAPSDVDIPLRLNVTPDKVGFIRIHDIQPAAARKPSPGPNIRPRHSYPLTIFTRVH